MTEEKILLHEPQKIGTVKEFCRFKKEVHYMGVMVNKETNITVKDAEPIVKIGKAYYTSHLVYMQIDQCTYAEFWLCKGFDPTRYIWLEDCPIRIEEKEMFDGKSALYAFWEKDLEKAKTLARNLIEQRRRFEITFNKKVISSEEFLKLK